MIFGTCPAPPSANILISIRRLGIGWKKEQGLHCHLALARKELVE
jgi:hypothetical protein